MTEFKVPELGENVAGGDVMRVLVNVGDTVTRAALERALAKYLANPIEIGRAHV